MNYGMRFMTLYSRQGSRPSPWKRNARKQNGILRDQILLSHVISDPQPVDQRLSTAWSFPALLVIQCNPDVNVCGFGCQRWWVFMDHLLLLTDIELGWGCLPRAFSLPGVQGLPRILSGSGSSTRLCLPGLWHHWPQPGVTQVLTHEDSLSIKYACMYGKRSGRIYTLVLSNVNLRCLNFLDLL